MGWDDIEKESAHLSAQQVGMYQRCSLQYKYRYIDGIRQPPNSKIIVGSAVHKSIEQNYGHKFLTKKPANKNEVMDVYDKSFQERKTDVDFEGEDPGKAKDRGYAMAQEHYDHVAPSVQPVEKPELRIEVPLPWSKRTMLAFIDVIADVQKMKRVIIDNKTTSRAYQQWDVDLNLQLTNYAFVSFLLKKKIGGLGVDVLIENKKGASSQRLFTERTPEDLARYGKNLQTVEHGIQQGVFVPTNNPQTCSWCGYNDRCWAVAVRKKKEARGVLIP